MLSNRPCLNDHFTRLRVSRGPSNSPPINRSESAQWRASTSPLMGWPSPVHVSFWKMATPERSPTWKRPPRTMVVVVRLETDGWRVTPLGENRPVLMRAPCRKSVALEGSTAGKGTRVLFEEK